MGCYAPYSINVDQNMMSFKEKNLNGWDIFGDY